MADKRPRGGAGEGAASSGSTRPNSITVLAATALKKKKDDEEARSEQLRVARMCKEGGDAAAGFAYGTAGGRTEARASLLGVSVFATREEFAKRVAAVATEDGFVLAAESEAVKPFRAFIRELELAWGAGAGLPERLAREGIVNWEALGDAVENGLTQILTAIRAHSSITSKGTAVDGRLRQFASPHLAQLICDAVFPLACLLEPKFRTARPEDIKVNLELLTACLRSVNQKLHRDHEDTTSLVFIFPAVRSALTEYLRGSHDPERLAVIKKWGAKEWFLTPMVSPLGTAAFRPCGAHRGLALPAGHEERPALFISFRILSERGAGVAACAELERMVAQLLPDAEDVMGSFGVNVAIHATPSPLSKGGK